MTTLRNVEILGIPGVHGIVVEGRKIACEHFRISGDTAAELWFDGDQTPQTGRVVLRPKWETGRRFELARLLGDRLAGNADGRLFPATLAYTYRQKLQRAFAAELLCPFEALEDMLRGDYSAESIEDAAEYFIVSERAVRTLLVNHGRLDRDELAGDFDAAAA